jgi:ribonucleotide reductase beta subunit family protein with ferritin-like domain/putative sterol carrier protein
VATMEKAAERQAAAVEKISYRDLYERWEKGNWRSTEIDFSQDHTDWHETFTDLERRAALWNYSMFFHGEDSVTDNLSPYIDAAPLEEQKYFLATQQVDEARHAVFFGRFMREVVERGETIASSLDATHAELTWGFRKTFEHLDKVADGLRKDRSLPNFAAAITMYHLVVEATLAQPGQHFIESYLVDRGILPGFRSGMENVSRDEQRHIGFGVKCLSDAVKQDPDCKYAVADLLREVMQYTIAVFVPPNWDRRYVEIFDSTIEDVFEQGVISFESKMRAAGLPLEELPGPPPLPIDMTPRERVDRALMMLQAGILGEKNGPPSRDPEVVEAYFDTIRRTTDSEAVQNGPMTIQWDFKDAEPWHLRIANGSTAVERGRLEDADVTLRCRFEDWVDIGAKREDVRLAIAKGKLRPKGSIRALWRMQKVFG